MSIGHERDCYDRQCPGCYGAYDGYSGDCLECGEHIEVDFDEPCPECGAEDPFYAGSGVGSDAADRREERRQMGLTG